MPNRERRRRSPMQRTKRRLLKTIPYLLGAAALASAYGAAKYFDIDPLGSLPEAPKDEGLPQVVRDLVKWNDELRNRPSNFDTVAPKVIDSATGFYADRMNAMFPNALSLKASEIKPAAVFYSSPAFAINRSSVLSCINDPLLPDSEAYLDDELKVFHLNREIIIKRAPGLAASSIFRLTTELLHNATPKPIPSNMPPEFTITDPLTNTELPVIEQKGALIKYNRLSNARPGKVCISALNSELQSALVAYSTQQTLGGIGMDVNFHPGVAELVSRLRGGILFRWYRNDHKPLLLLQQQSKADQILEDIGRFRRAESNIHLGSRIDILADGFNYINTLMSTGQVI